MHKSKNINKNEFFQQKISHFPPPQNKNRSRKRRFDNRHNLSDPLGKIIQQNHIQRRQQLQSIGHQLRKLFLRQLQIG